MNDVINGLLEYASWGEERELCVEAVNLITSQQQRITELEARLKAFGDVVHESTGVIGWHLNGDVATWEELGLFEPKEKGHE